MNTQNWTIGKKMILLVSFLLLLLLGVGIYSVINAQATAMMETVRILAKMVGMEEGSPVAAPKKKQLHHLEIKPAAPMARKAAPVTHAKPASPKNDDIFPLHEDDLKEF